ARSANHASLESNLFDLVKVIHSCFDVSIPKSCELAFYSIDEDFIEGLREVVYRPFASEYSDEQLKRIGMTRDQIEEAEEHDRLRWEKLIKRPEYTPAVKSKLESLNIDSITYGDRVGYSLDRLIDRYHRAGSRRKSKRSGPDDEYKEILWRYFKGQRLCSSYPWTKQLARRPPFEEFEARISRTRTAPK